MDELQDEKIRIEMKNTDCRDFRWWIMRVC